MSAAMTPTVHATLADPSLRAALVAMVRRRVPAPEVDEIVQATLTEALASRGCPDDPERIRRWVHGIARHKIVDFHRRHRREHTAHEHESEVLESVPADSAPHDAVDLLRWAEREMPETHGRTLEWLLREGEGEKLEEIANEAALPAPQVRQRVARLRRHFRTRWAAQVAAAVALLALAIVAAALLRRTDREAVKPVIAPDPVARARELRRESLSKCAAGAWDPCVKGLDEAAALDPAGDSADEVRKAREAAARAKLPPAPSSVPSSAPPVPKSAPTVAPSVTVAPTAPVAPTKSYKPGPSKKSSKSSKAGPAWDEKSGAGAEPQELENGAGAKSK
ncbi:MAG: sigma-70 family RNA polymerase sigma factor [Deltaproteobacteria bacterium]|nr:sigma-70 family RNA polymerase sigma factor [Deltaproteobacteria bacterium]